jgi:hypothetical protein
LDQGHGLTHPLHEAQFTGLLSVYDSGDPAKYLLIEPQKTIEGHSLASWQCTSSQFLIFFRND